MLEFIKMFGMGILYTILSPVILLVFLIFVAYSIVNYFVCEVIYLSGFFMGKRFEEQTKLDKALAKRRKEKKELLNAQYSEISNNEVEELNGQGGDFNV